MKKILKLFFITEIEFYPFLLFKLLNVYYVLMII